MFSKKKIYVVGISTYFQHRHSGVQFIEEITCANKKITYVYKKLNCTMREKLRTRDNDIID